MRNQLQYLALTIFVVTFSTNSLLADPIQEEEVAYQSQNYESWWGTELEWRFDELPTKGLVKKHRMPYAGHIYPDNSGGTARVLRKYDVAFNNGRQSATSFEYRDIEIHKEATIRSGPFGFIRRRVNSTPNWAGHCNGWAAAAIRHAEPTQNVTQNGVTFTPADIKGLLAELYTYTDIEFLGGIDAAINPGTFHVVVCNWLGRKDYPIAFDSSVGKEVWNFPAYGYTSSSAKRGDNKVEVKINLGYVHYTNGEFNRAPSNARHYYFHYTLDLNDDGEIIGGDYFRDSNRLDMLWVPLLPTPGGQEGNKEGNPYLDVEKVLALWRASAPPERRKIWFTLDPAEQDNVEFVADTETSEQPATGDVVAENTAEDSTAGDSTNAQDSGEVETTTDEVEDSTTEAVVDDEA